MNMRVYELNGERMMTERQRLTLNTEIKLRPNSRVGLCLFAEGRGNQRVFCVGSIPKVNAKCS